MKPKLNIGLALGSGSSRGWSHIGVIRAFTEMGIAPNIVCGTSIGALVGGAYSTNSLDKLEGWACSLTKFETLKFLDINASRSGLVNTEKFRRFLVEHLAGDEAMIEELGKRYAAVSTDLENGREEWLTKGSIVDAVLASLSLPGLFSPVRNRDRWLVDGGLVNPVPVSVCRALGADVVIAVNLNGDIVGKHSDKRAAKLKSKAESETEIKTGDGAGARLGSLVKDYTSSWFPDAENKMQAPSIFEAIASSINITQDRITRSRLAGDPPDILITPKLAHIGLLEFYRAQEAIEEGKVSTRRMQEEIFDALGMARVP